MTEWNFSLSPVGTATCTACWTQLSVHSTGTYRVEQLDQSVNRHYPLFHLSLYEMFSHLLYSRTCHRDHLCNETIAIETIPACSGLHRDLCIVATSQRDWWVPFWKTILIKAEHAYSDQTQQVQHNYIPMTQVKSPWGYRIHVHAHTYTAHTSKRTTGR